VRGLTTRVALFVRAVPITVCFCASRYDGQSCRVRTVSCFAAAILRVRR
jgi:hypothetical protein